MSEVDDRIEAALDKVSAICHGEERWTMSIPAREDYDHDIVISRALAAARDEIATLRDAVERKDAAILLVIQNLKERKGTEGEMRMSIRDYARLCAALASPAAEKRCPSCGGGWKDDKGGTCDNEFHIWENRPTAEKGEVER